MIAAAKASAAESFNEIAAMRIELRDSDPLIWRKVEVPTSVTLKVLHDILQAVMGWFDYHLWEFTIAEQRYRVPMDNDDSGRERRIDPAKVRLRDVLKQRETTIDYLYDFGDAWEHRLIVTDIRQGDPGVSYPRYVGGEWNAPPEDCGGLSGFYEMLEAVADTEHPEHDGVVEWLDDYDPKAIDELPIRYVLSRVANSRNAAAVRIAKKRSPPRS
jgi:hypothetical protein